MEKYLSVIFLYNRAGWKKLFLAVCAVPLCFLAICYLRIGNPAGAGPYMFFERAFGGVWPVLAFIVTLLLGLMSAVNALNGKKAQKAAHSTTGYTIRRLRHSPTSSFFTVFVYYLALILLFWAAALLSLYAIGTLGFAMAGAEAMRTRFALGLLRTAIGRALIPIANPAFVLFNVVSVAALAAECAKSSYLRWHNGRPSYGILLAGACMFLVWGGFLSDIYIFMAIIFIAVYAAVSFGDVIARERHPKGDPFLANQYAGIMDLDGFEFDESSYAPEANSLLSAYGVLDPNRPASEVYGRDAVERIGSGAATVSDADSIPGSGADTGKRKRFSPALLRRRFMPLGINLERANALLGACIFAGVGGNLLFLLRYIPNLNRVTAAIKGVTIAAGVRMPYFWALQAHAYDGYIAAILLAFFLQCYWNYEYYNKKTRSVYVMKRLPDSKEYVKTIFIAPALQALFIAFLMVLQTALDLVIYALATPHIALQASCLAWLWPF